MHRHGERQPARAGGGSSSVTARRKQRDRARAHIELAKRRRFIRRRR
ncbi:MAG: hypothetical protein ACLSHG_03855 [Oscillospiraceae bacterium]